MRKSFPVITLLTIAATATMLAGCASSSREDPKTGALSDTEQWANKVTVDAHPEELLLAVHAEGLSTNQAAALQGFIEQWAFAEGGLITVRAPQPRAAAPGGVVRMAEQTRDFLVSQGAPAHRVEVVAYDSTGAAQAPLVVSYDRYKANTPTCGLEMENYTRTMMNRPTANFGCAVTANMAAQVANPEDLLRPRGSTPSDAGRRQTVLDKYRRGEKTASEREEQATGAISRAVN
ncbi:MAG: hypothetical protein BGN86_02310 [Caulobacterales bacterium 68-7]|nr:CpaD family pilus assembly protein [Caulobacterales bacterium]OJU09695.1 MAG: hypothetical protein BGN86_02310 [Caulobacterales bacterium 68-7]